MERLYRIVNNYLEGSCYEFSKLECKIVGYSAFNIRPSPIRALMKYTKTPGVISFAGGNPDPAVFPVAEFSEASAILAREGKNIAPSTVPQFSVMRRLRDTSQNGWHPEWAVKQNLKRCLSQQAHRKEWTFSAASSSMTATQ